MKIQLPLSKGFERSLLHLLLQAIYQFLAIFLQQMSKIYQRLELSPHSFTQAPTFSLLHTQLLALPFSFLSFT